MPKYKICKICERKKNISFFRSHRYTCKKCEYNMRSEYLKIYQQVRIQKRREAKLKAQEHIKNNKLKSTKRTMYDRHRIVCVCGGYYQRRNKASHLKTLKHKTLYDQSEEIKQQKKKFLDKIIIWI